MLYHHLHALPEFRQGALRRRLAPDDWDVLDLIIAGRLTGEEAFSLRRQDVDGPTVCVPLDPQYRYFAPVTKDRAHQAVRRLLSTGSGEYLVASADIDRRAARRRWETRTLRHALRAADAEPSARWYRPGRASPANPRKT